MCIAIAVSGRQRGTERERINKTAKSFSMRINIVQIEHFAIVVIFSIRFKHIEFHENHCSIHNNHLKYINKIFIYILFHIFDALVYFHMRFTTSSRIGINGMYMPFCRRFSSFFFLALLIAWILCVFFLCNYGFQYIAFNVMFVYI